MTQKSGVLTPIGGAILLLALTVSDAIIRYLPAVSSSCCESNNHGIL